MKYSIGGFVWNHATLLIAFLVLLPALIHARHLVKAGNEHQKQNEYKTLELSTLTKLEMQGKLNRKAEAAGHPLKIAGSRLPDCSHACGSCTPCRLVKVSFVCSSLDEAEPCPMAYKCICNNKSYPVP
ncbi:hypothetical protein Leryth_005967 [Lithospermum erythrorhizon]|nr:hypothetical protein Leryth_005967 [Lithospermum erythrorhizon]